MTDTRPAAVYAAHQLEARIRAVGGRPATAGLYTKGRRFRNPWDAAPGRLTLAAAGYTVADFTARWRRWAAK